MRSLLVLSFLLISLNSYAYETYHSFVIFRNITQVNHFVYGQEANNYKPGGWTVLSFQIYGDAFVNFRDGDKRKKFKMEKSFIEITESSAIDFTNLMNADMAQCQDFALTAMKNPDDYAFYIEGIGSSKYYAGNGNSALNYDSSQKGFYARSSEWNGSSSDENSTAFFCGLIRTDKSTRRSIGKLRYAAGVNTPRPVRKP